jgi:hypothetical protein
VLTKAELLARASRKATYPFRSVLRGFLGCKPWEKISSGWRVSDR